MKRLARKWSLLISTSAALALPITTLAAAPQEDGPTRQELMQKLEAMQAKIDQLESRVAQSSSQPTASADRDAAIDQVLKDAERRSHFFDTDGTLVGGWNEQKQQFYLGSSDGKFYFHPIAIFQARGNVNYRDEGKSSGGSSTEEGLEIRRAKFGFDGNVFTPDLTYKLQWQDNSTGSPGLEYAWAQYTFAHNALGTADLAIRAGQGKTAIFKEEFTSDTLQLMAERSLANALVGGTAPPSNLIQGVDFLVLGAQNPLHADFQVSDGYGSGNSGFSQPHGTAITFPQTPSAPPSNPANFGTGLRVDYKLFGDWADAADFTGQNSGKHDLLDVGGGIDYTDAEGSGAIRYTLDAQYQMARQFTAFIAGYGDHFDFRDTAAGVAGSQNNFGFQAEAGYSLTPAWQLIGRYSVSKLDDAFKINGTSTFQEYAVGLNWFGPNATWGNHAKFTIDLNYLPDGSPNEPGLDYLPSAGNTQIVLRTQFQLWF